MSEDKFAGTSVSYTEFFEQHRAQFYTQQKKCAKEFIGRLEMAIIISVKMTSGKAAKMLNLSVRKPMDKNKVCNVCQSRVEDNQHLFTYLRAKKIRHSGDYSTEDGFTLHWVHENSEHAKQLAPFEWHSGPLLLCKECLELMHWYEKETVWKNVQMSIDKQDFTQLSPLFVLYASLIKSLSLAQFFELQLKSLLQDPLANDVCLLEVKQCIVNSCDAISSIGKQISELGADLTSYNPRELVLQRNIAQHCAHVIRELTCLFASIQPEKTAEPTVFINMSKDESHIEIDTSILQDILGGFSCLLCNVAGEAHESKTSPAAKFSSC